MTPKISLIVTVYNREHFLAAALQSVLDQSYRDYELLVWDDGSTDRSLAIAQEFAQRDRRVRVFSGRQTYPKVLAMAHTEARGDYIGWLDSDDLLAPTALAATAAVLDTQPDIGMVYTNYFDMNAAGKTIGLGRRCAIPYSPERLLVDFMTFHFRLFRRSLYDQVGGIDVTKRCSPDYDVCLKFSEVTEIYHLAEPLYYYRHHSSSISQTNRVMQIEEAQAAIEAALKRRGLTEQYQLNVEIIGRFSLRRVNCGHSPQMQLDKHIATSREG
jgi:glycosyltransferase involved in cell wall biosynthesis